MTINFSEIISNAKSVLFAPASFWVSRKERSESNIRLFAGYFLPLLFIEAGAVFLGELFNSSHFYALFAVFRTLIELILFATFYFIGCYFIGRLMKTFGGVVDSKAARQLIAYSMTPVLLVSTITGLFPFIYPATILGVYSFYIFWIGAKELAKVPEPNKERYIIVTLLVNFFIFTFLNIFLHKLLMAFY
ncbi:MAG: hypothetical protein CSA36_06995 [Draconibacterium sp.]|nr:MAG: hypothetical protein CSA36_06995 [Draconibacterium sp.]